MPSDTQTLSGHRDALLVVDSQRDFLPGGALGMPHGDEVVPVLNRYIGHFAAAGRPIIATRGWHPPDHCSFQAQGGPWPPHCIADSEGAAFAPELALPDGTLVISKGTNPGREGYSGFEGTGLEHELHRLDVEHLFIGGLTADYCVLETVKDALLLGFDVFLLTDAIRAVDVEPADGQRAIEQMLGLGAHALTLEELGA